MGMGCCCVACQALANSQYSSPAWLNIPIGLYTQVVAACHSLCTTTVVPSCQQPSQAATSGCNPCRQDLVGLAPRAAPLNQPAHLRPRPCTQLPPWLTAGKTMLAKAVAHHTTAAFIRVVGSEFVQKYLGEGPRMVRDVFRLAKENEPAIIFIDEVLH